MWKITYRIYRKKKGQLPRFDTFQVEIDPDEYVLDGIEKVWAFHDRSLTFRHACHHSTCGVCGMRVDGRERLTCITKIKDVCCDGGTLTIEPLRNFPVISDLVVDLGQLYRKMYAVHAPQIIPLSAAPVEGDGIDPQPDAPRISPEQEYLRMPDCIECGLCISACPTAVTDPDYLSPAALAAIHLQGVPVHPDLMVLADNQEGLWRCHSAYECSEVCPSHVEPAWRIMNLRRHIALSHIKLSRGDDA